MRSQLLVSAAAVAAASLAVYGFRPDGQDGPAITAVAPASSSLSASYSGPLQVIGIYQERITQANEPGCCDWVVMEQANDRKPLQLGIEVPVDAIAVIRLGSTLRIGAPDRYQEELFATIEVDGVVDEGGQVQARVAGVDPVFSSIENWEQVTAETIVSLRPGRHTVRAVWRDTNGTTAAQANKATLSATVYAAATCTGDTNGDGVVDVEDLLEVLRGWGSCPM